MKDIETRLGSKKSKKTQILEHEQSLAKKLDGVAQPNSGALAHRKGDVLLDTFLLDSKETEGVEIRISKKDLTKVSREAREVNRRPGLVITFENDHANEWVMIPLETFSELLKLE